MKALPHHYTVTALAEPDGEVNLSSEGLDSLPSAPPAEYGGPGNRWSPETLLVAAVADCFVLSFRAIAAASKLPWNALSREVEGTLERIDRTTMFTQFKVRASLRVPPDTNETRAQRILERAEESCLITNSLSGPTHLDANIEVDA